MNERKTMNELTYKRQTKQRPVKIEDADGQIKEYSLREVKAAKRDQYLDKLSNRLLTDNKGNIIGMKKYEGMQSDLLLMCMHDADGKLVDKAFLDDLPGTAVVDMFKAAQVLNGLREAVEIHKLMAERLVAWLSSRPTEPPLTAEDVEAFLDKAKKEIENTGDATKKEQEEA